MTVINVTDYPELLKVLRNNKNIKESVNITISIIKTIILPQNVSHLFENWYGEIIGLEYINTDYVQNMDYMFAGCIQLKDLSKLKDWNVSYVRSCISMFDGCVSLIDLRPLSTWTLAAYNNCNLTRMFHRCSNVTIPCTWKIHQNTIVTDIFKETKLTECVKNISKTNEIYLLELFNDLSGNS